MAKFFRGYEMCKKCGFVKLDKGMCCEINKYSGDLRIEMEKAVLDFVIKDTKGDLIIRDMAITQESVKNVKEWDMLNSRGFMRN